MSCCGSSASSCGTQGGCGACQAADRAAQPWGDSGAVSFLDLGLAYQRSGDRDPAPRDLRVGEIAVYAEPRSGGVVDPSGLTVPGFDAAQWAALSQADRDALLARARANDERGLALERARIANAQEILRLTTAIAAGTAAVTAAVELVRLENARVALHEQLLATTAGNTEHRRTDLEIARLSAARAAADLEAARLRGTVETSRQSVVTAETPAASGVPTWVWLLSGAALVIVVLYYLSTMKPKRGKSSGKYS